MDMFDFIAEAKKCEARGEWNRATDLWQGAIDNFEPRPVETDADKSRLSGIVRAFYRAQAGRT